MPRPTLLTAAVSDPRTPVVVAARRTPVGTKGGRLSGVDVVGLASPVLSALVGELGRVRADVRLEVDDVVLGNCMGPGGDPARVAALAAGLGRGVPGLTVDRQCGSGLDAIGVAARSVLAGHGIVLAGGAESASTAPTRLALQPDGSRRAYDRARFAPDELGDPGMGEAADALAEHARVSRRRQDAYAARSHARAVAAASGGRFDAELVTVAGVDHDERPRAITEAVLSRFRPAFTRGGTVTAGNACGISDGAAAVALVPESLRSTLGLPGLAVRAHVVSGVDPNVPGLGPVPAVRGLLEAAGLTTDDVGTFEMTEAFASQVLACTDALGLDPLGADADRCCPDGGAIALGHPWGASGALLMVRLFATMVRSGGPRFGVATCAVGGGQGVATLVERVG
ncbi:MAG TPA: thiolase family protein [Actinomycetales bacterium]|nr:thiolase family protein [Actinomycetales bacterium]